MLRLFRKITQNPLSINILIGFFLGILLGFLAIYADFSNFVIQWIYPLGEIFISLLKFIAIPIVFIAVMAGIINFADIKGFSNIARKTIIVYFFTTIFAISIGFLLVKTIQPGKMMDREAVEQLQQHQKLDDYIPLGEEESMNNRDITSILKDIVPENFFKSMSDNTKVLQIIFMAVFFGIIILKLPNEKTNVLKTFINQLNEVVLKYVEMVMQTAPLGVFALMAGMIVSFGGELSIAKALAMYILTVTLGLFLFLILFYPLFIHLFTSINFKDFLKTMYPVQLLAFSSSSSAVTFPVTKKQVESGLGISEKVSSFVLPLGMTINMDGTSLYQTVAALFIAQIYGIELAITQQFFLVFVALLSSIGTPAIPGGSIVVLVFILSSIGLPPEGLVLILGVDRPLDMLRTTVNVTGDAFVCCFIDKNKNSKIRI
ncbi:MAG: dicarboxylate/amino acid:cation symporter [Bacteroidales bacterium]|nr:dicarboxylate/amino acid:cation symporter [Bacteroidales bacterium]